MVFLARAFKSLGISVKKRWCGLNVSNFFLPNQGLTRLVLSGMNSGRGQKCVSTRLSSWFWFRDGADTGAGDSVDYMMGLLNMGRLAAWLCVYFFADLSPGRKGDDGILMTVGVRHDRIVSKPSSTKTPSRRSKPSSAIFVISFRCSPGTLALTSGVNSLDLVQSGRFVPVSL